MNFHRIQKPIDLAKRNEHLGYTFTNLPDDYLEIIQFTSNMESENCKIYGLQSINKVVLDDTSFYVIAELIYTGVFAMEMYRNDKEIFFIDFEDNVFTAVGKSIHKAIENEIIRRNLINCHGSADWRVIGRSNAP